jgi:hypothetical protein
VITANKFLVKVEVIKKIKSVLASSEECSYNLRHFHLLEFDFHFKEIVNKRSAFLLLSISSLKNHCVEDSPLDWCAMSHKVHLEATNQTTQKYLVYFVTRIFIFAIFFYILLATNGK